MQYSTTEFETLYKQCFPSSMKLALSYLHDEDEARDIVQEVFIKLWESERLVGNPLAFTLRSVKNACVNRINMLDTRERIRQRISLENPPDDCSQEKRHEEVLSSMQRLLTTRELQVVEKLYREGLSYRETSETLGISVATVNKHIVTALKKLRTHFKIGNS